MRTAFRALLALLLLSPIASVARAEADWRTDPVWHDGLAEKATYKASRIVYGKPRPYSAILFTNKEQHDRRTNTKSDKSTDTVEVFKHNHIETIPTPNYPYHYQATSHFTVDGLLLTRLDVSSQEFCGTSFKQLIADLTQKAATRSWTYREFSYMPEAGWRDGQVTAPGAEPVIPADGLPLALRAYDFAAKKPVRFWMLPSQKSNRSTSNELVAAEVRFAAEEDGSYKLELVTFAPTKMAGTAWDQASKPYATVWMAKDRQHVMTRYNGVDGQKYELEKVERVNYWTIVGE
jgi:hypothetical protein